MNPRIDELPKVADKIAQQVDSAVDRWRNLPETPFKSGNRDSRWAKIKETLMRARG